jgi:hypothetical protein
MPHTTAQIDNLNWKLKQKHRNSNKFTNLKFEPTQGHQIRIGFRI